MRREGRQHGMVRTFIVAPSPTISLDDEPQQHRRIINKTDSPPTAGLFTKVSTKPTNHSKFTGKCGQSRCNGCHDHPVSKSRVKSKGSHKRLNVLVFSGSSVTQALDDHYDDDGSNPNSTNNYDYDYDYYSDRDFEIDYDSDREVEYVASNLPYEIQLSESGQIDLAIPEDGGITELLGEPVSIDDEFDLAIPFDDNEWYLV